MDAGIVLYKLADEFDLSRSTTEERLRLQKTIYLLQACGFKIGYGFSWYKYGPYSQELVYDSYRALSAEREKYADKTADLGFSEQTGSKIDHFKAMLGEALTDLKQLELLASVDFVRRTWLSPEATPNEVATELRQHKTRFYNGDPIADPDIKDASATLDDLKQALAS